MKNINLTLQISALFTAKFNLNDQLSEIFSKQNADIESQVLSKLKIISLKSGGYRCMFVYAPQVNEDTCGECEYQEHVCDNIEQVIAYLSQSKESVPWLELAVSVIENTHRHTVLIDGIEYVIKGERIGTDGAITLYHLFSGKWMWFNTLTGENVIADDFDFKHGKVQTILVRAGLREPISTFVFE